MKRDVSRMSKAPSASNRDKDRRKYTTVNIGAMECPGPTITVNKPVGLLISQELLTLIFGRWTFYTRKFLKVKQM
jgi:hypothetical protein